MHSKKRQFRFSYVSGNMMNEHITNFNQLVADLLNLDVTFEYEDLALMVLESLPEEFEFLETTLLYGKNEVTFNGVIAALYSHELRRKEKLKGSSGVAIDALVVRGHSQSRSREKKWRSKLVEIQAQLEVRSAEEAENRISWRSRKAVGAYIPILSNRITICHSSLMSIQVLVSPHYQGLYKSAHYFE